MRSTLPLIVFSFSPPPVTTQRTLFFRPAPRKDGRVLSTQPDSPRPLLPTLAIPVRTRDLPISHTAMRAMHEVNCAGGRRALEN